jgi:hypothetical protein
MDVCMHVRMNATCVYTYRCAPMYVSKICMHVPLYACVCMRAYAFVCLYACVCVCMFVNTFVCLYVCMRLHACVWHPCMFIHNLCMRTGMNVCLRPMYVFRVSMTFVCMCLCMHVFAMYACMPCMDVCMHVRMYAMHNLYGCVLSVSSKHILLSYMHESSHYT